MSAQALVDRLDFCKPSGKDSWIARCPAHPDSSPSLSIKEQSDGTVLVHCHAGCGALEVITAVGVDWADLFPPSDRNYHAEKKTFNRSVDELVVEIAIADRAAGKLQSQADKDREFEAFGRLISETPSPEDTRQDIESSAMQYMEAQN